MINILSGANLSLKALGLLGLTTFWGGLVYRFFGLGSLGLVLSLILTLLSFIILLKIERKHNQQNSDAQAANSLNGEKNWIAAYLASLFFCFYTLINAGTVKSIVSPWEVMPAVFFAAYFFSSVLLMLILTRTYKLSVLLLTFHFFLSYTVILFVYRLGYGYDYFIHQATLELIDKQGWVDPRPFYYLGQYGLLTIIHKISCLPLVWLHRLLVPLTAAIFLPSLFNRSLRVLFKENFRPFYTLLFLIVPLPFLTFSTPQNFALLLLIFVLLLSISYKNKFDLTLMIILALAAFLTHPIAGVPAMILVCSLLLRDSKLSEWRKRLGLLIIFLLAATLLPLAFYLFEKPQVNFADWSLKNFLPSLSLTSAAADNIFFNFIYFYSYNFWLIFIIISLTGLWLAKKFDLLARLMPFAVISGGLFLAFILTKILPFNFLIEYEQNDYPQRILFVACLFLAPFVMFAVGQLIGMIRQQNQIFRTSWLIFVLLLLSASLYLAYPRYDRYFNSHGYSVGEADIAAVNWIEQDAGGDYIVLANQQVSVAALSRFGFKKYYPGDIFYYPIPTGGPLYNYYLQMVYQKPTREIMAEAKALAGVQRGYFVLNKYWTDFIKVSAEAKLSASSWRQFGDGQVYVFSY